MEANIWTTTTTTTTTAAISIRKATVTVSLESELSTMPATRSVNVLFLLFVFTFVAPLGVAIGTDVTSGHVVDMRAHMLAGSVLKAVAAGVLFLYVTYSFQMLGEELTGHDSRVTKIVVTVTGFGGPWK